MKILRAFWGIGLMSVLCQPVLASNYSYNDFPPKGSRTVDDVIKRYQPIVEPRLKIDFARAEVSYPPKKIALFAMKNEQKMELWAEEDDTWHLIKNYPITKLSGVMGPKKREGDKQIPEGIYQVEFLNPNSQYHLSMKLNYPNDFDLKYAKLEGRTKPGTNIFIHGKESSVGCLAIGDVAIEELFVLAKNTGIDNIDVVISPYDPRIRTLVPTLSEPYWTSILYRDITHVAQQFDSKRHL
ncbi:L,D-transpeptidase family protein [Photobacterium damselae]|uniref:L,D-transpeptidase family protein n=1 Tax=Photobacterium damselae TaxID=38293 RepID=UPI0029348641|nr:L,D-transpeptidase family protein [Photobacterium damselae]